MYGLSVFTTFFVMLSADREKSPQTLLFSATLPRWVYEMSQKYMKNEVKKVDMVGTERVQTSTTVQVNRNHYFVSRQESCARCLEGNSM